MAGLVAGSPALLRTFAQAMSDSADGIGDRIAGLDTALTTFFESNSEYGPKSSAAVSILEYQSGVASELAATVTTFASALELAELAGMGQMVDFRVPLTPSDLVLVDAAYLELLLDGPGTDIYNDRIETLQADLVEHDANKPERSGRFIPGIREWNAERWRINNEISQYLALAMPDHLGWAGAGGEQFASIEEFDAAVLAGTSQATALLPEPSNAVHPRTRSSQDRAAQAAFAAAHPFLDAALDNDVFITPGRLDILVELDGFVVAPLPSFLSSRTTAEWRHPTYDWTADGCSGPIPDPSEDTCLRHDFMYRNGRMVRDQWGTGPGFADDVKGAADSRFGDEVFDAYDWWEVDTFTWLWLQGAEVAVTNFGSVDAAWSPPADGNFYGST